MTLPETHVAALHWLDERGGEGSVDRYGALVANGSRSSTASAQVWLRLFTTGHVESAGRNRIKLSPAGKLVVGTKGVPANPDTFVGRGERAPMLDEEPAE